MPSFVVRADRPEDLRVVDIKTDFTQTISELDEALYVTQVADLRDIYEARFGEDTWFDLAPNTKAELIRTAGTYLEGFNDGTFNWMDALTDSLRFTLGDLPDEIED